MTSTSGEEVLGFHTSNNAATHLGRRLYSTTPPAIAELVANAYDGYATRVDIRLRDDSVIVADNGCGMSYADLQERYIEVGQPKKNIPVPRGSIPRSPMGKKGIGKLASFSIGNSYTVYTRSTSTEAWISFNLTYSEMVSSENQDEYEVPLQRLEVLTDELSTYSNYEHGFIVQINDIRKTSTRSTLDGLDLQLSRRFYLHRNDDEFKVTLNGEEVDFSGKFLYEKVNTATYIGFSSEEIQDLFYRDDFDPESFIEYKPTSNSKVNDEIIDELKQHGVKGWIGALSTPTNKSGLKLGAVLVYINGKVADEDFLKEHIDAQMGSQYIVGEFFADYLNNEQDEPITSSRQGLDEADKEVASLLQLVIAMRARAIRQWNAYKDKKVVESLSPRIANDPQYKDWRDKLEPTQRKLNNKLLKAFSVVNEMDDNVSEERTIAMVNAFTQIVEDIGTLQIANTMKDKDLSQEEVFLLLGQYFGRVASHEKIRQAEVISQRMKAIEQLDDLMKEPGTLEKAFQEHLARNPWLINPFWNQTGKSDKEVQATREVFNQIYDASEERYRKTFIDILVTTADERFPIIVELKKNTAKGYAKVNFNKIIEQIGLYRKALVAAMNQEDKKEIGNDDSKIKAYFIASQNIGLPGQGNAIELTVAERRMLEAVNITLLTYKDLIDHAYRAYREFYEIASNEAHIPYFPFNYTLEDDEEELQN